MTPKQRQQARIKAAKPLTVYDPHFASPWDLKGFVPHADEIIEERRPGTPIKSKDLNLVDYIN